MAEGYTVTEKQGVSKKGNDYMMLVVSFKGVELGNVFLEDKDIKLIELLKNEQVHTKK